LSGGAGQVALGGQLTGLDPVQAGRHGLANAAVALAVVFHLGGDIEKARIAIEACPAGPGRGVVHRLADGIDLIDESYNANPASMAAALGVFGARPDRKRRRILVLGEMLELGHASQKLHRALAEPVLAAGPDKVILIGAGMKHLASELPETMVDGWFENEAAARNTVLNLLACGDLIMVKGSNGVGLGALVLAIIAGHKYT